MSFRVPEAFRVPRPHADGSYASDKGNTFGLFALKRNGVGLLIIAADGAVDPSCPKESYGWEHVSVSVIKPHGYQPIPFRTPTWDEMCYIKKLFWEDEDCVVQYHPPKSEYVDRYPVLHLWCWRGGEFPRPPAVLV